MKKSLLIVAALLLSISINAQDMKIQGIVDGDAPGGLPKMLHFYVMNDIADISIYGFESANNGAASTGTPEFTFPPAVPATAGDHIYVTSNEASFTSYFGFAADYVNGAANNNGDDAIILYQNGVAVDVYGVAGVNGDNEAWDYTDSFSQRNVNAQPTTTFAPADWSFEGREALDANGCGTLTLTNDTCAITYLTGASALPVEAQSFSVE